MWAYLTTVCASRVSLLYEEEVPFLTDLQYIQYTLIRCEDHEPLVDATFRRSIVLVSCE
jgi:hypothetical protein